MYPFPAHASSRKRLRSLPFPFLSSFLLLILVATMNAMQSRSFYLSQLSFSCVSENTLLPVCNHTIVTMCSMTLPPPLTRSSLVVFHSSEHSLDNIEQWEDSTSCTSITTWNFSFSSLHSKSVLTIMIITVSYCKTNVSNFSNHD